MIQPTMVDKIVRRSGTIWTLGGIGAIIIVILVAFFFIDYLYNFISGPFEMTTDDVLAIENIGSQREVWVTVTGDEGVDTGYEYYTVNDSGQEKTEKYFPALWLEDRLLLIRTPDVPGEIVSMTWTGQLKQIPNDIQREVISDIEREVPEIEGLFLPFYLDDHNFRLYGFIGIAVGLVAVLGGFWGVYRGMGWRENPASHPLMQRLKLMGEPEQIAQQIDNEMNQQGNKKLHKLTVTRNFLLEVGRASLSVMRHKDILWVYPKITTHRKYGIITTGKTYELIIKDRHGGGFQVRGKEAQVDTMMQGIGEVVPWAVFGYNDQLNNAWNRDRAGFIQAVAQRHEQWRAEQGGAATGPSA